MVPKQYAEILGKFLAGELNIKQLSNIIDDRLFELRQSPETTEERDFLSGIELTIHEIGDGFRSISDLEEYVKSLLIPEDNSVLWDFGKEETAKEIKSIFTGSTNDSVSISITTPEPVVDYRLQASFA